MSVAADTSRWQAALHSLSGQPVAVLGHVRPDGDCIGSQVALTRYLRAHGINATAINANAIPRSLQPFVGDTPFLTGEKAMPGSPEGFVGAVVAVDCADRTRFGERTHALVPPVQLMVDHHVSNTRFAAHNFLYPELASTTQALGELFRATGWTPDAVTAQALYVGLATDTGQFRFPSTTREVFALAQWLMECGASPAEASASLYENEKPGRVRLLQRYLASLRWELEGRVCLGRIALSDYTETETEREDSEGLVDYARANEGVLVGVLLEDRGISVKGSLRSKDPRLRMDRLAAAFNGGGHALAAGFHCYEPYPQLYARLLAALATMLAEAGITAAPASAVASI